MKNSVRKYYVLILFAAGIFASACAAEQVEVYAKVNDNENIYVGSNFSYHIIIVGDNRAAEVDLSSLQQYSPVPAGNKDYSQTSVSIINGKTNRSIKKQFVMTYLLTAKNPGLVQLPAVKVKIGGQVYTTNPVMINVAQPSQTDKLDLAVTLSEKKCYVGQPIILSVKFYILTDVGNFQFDLPILDEAIFHFDDPDASNPNAKEYRLADGPIVKVMQYKTTHHGKEAILIAFDKVLVPERSGKFDFGPSSVSANIVVGRKRGGFFYDTENQYKRFVTESPGLSLEVIDMPKIDKPVGFNGLVGKYTIEATAVPGEVSVGDPVTLTIKVGGNRYLKPVAWPDLENVAGFSENFKIPSERSAPKIEGNKKVFIQTIRPSNNEVKQIPPIPLVYFDDTVGKYVTVTTGPIKLNVTETKILTGRDIEGFGSVNLSSDVEAAKAGVSANYQNPDLLINTEFTLAAATVSPAYIFIWLPPLIALIGSIIFKITTHDSPEKLAVRMRKNAAAKAIAEIKKIGIADIAQSNLIAEAMKKFIGHRFSRPFGSLTCKDCYDEILLQCSDEELAADYMDILANFEQAIYAAVEVQIDQSSVDNIIELIKAIDKKAEDK